MERGQVFAGRRRIAPLFGWRPHSKILEVKISETSLLFAELPE